jgi:hypothetical protein
MKMDRRSDIWWVACFAMVVISLSLCVEATEIEDAIPTQLQDLFEACAAIDSREPSIRNCILHRLPCSRCIQEAAIKSLSKDCYTACYNKTLPTKSQLIEETFRQLNTQIEQLSKSTESRYQSHTQQVIDLQKELRSLIESQPKSASKASKSIDYNTAIIAMIFILLISIAIKQHNSDSQINARLDLLHQSIPRNSNRSAM